MFSQYVLHFPGKSKSIMENQEVKPIKIHKDVSILTTATKNVLHECKVLSQNSNIINTAQDSDITEWSMPLKLNLILTTLRNIKTKYALIVDGLDVIINKDIDETFIDDYENYDRKVIFGSSSVRHPKIEIEPAEMTAKPYYKHEIMFNRLNAGVCFGTVEDLITVYEKAQELYEQEPTQTSEQYFIRKVRATTDLIELDFNRTMIANIHLSDLEYWEE